MGKCFRGRGWISILMRGAGIISKYLGGGAWSCGEHYYTHMVHIINVGR